MTNGESTTDSYDAFFERLVGSAPHAWQTEIGTDPICRDRLLRIPTGFGKTAGVVLPWLHHRALRADDAWPRRLVFCLPMRVLVEQTERAVRGWVDSTGSDVPVHVLMGGVHAERWPLDVDRPAILLGTQDMLLSRALNRGYGAARGMWPMEFGMLHQDALWIMDEVQLMDVGLTTGAQLAAFRDQDVAATRARLRPVHTWWMSATLQPRWLETVDRAPFGEPPVRIAPAARRGGLWAVRKELARRSSLADADDVAAAARQAHVPGELTLVVVNRVETACRVYDALEAAFVEGPKIKRQRRADAPELRLVHSRFRGLERARWADEFLRRDAMLPEAGRILVATQVVEAGVDISARTLVTELCPWSSLVQRFGRAARYEGQQASIVVIGAVPEDDKAAAPYAAAELHAAARAVQKLLDREADASPRSLEAFEDELARSDAAFLAELYPYAPLHVLRRRDLDDLFDTSADLSGADLDVSRYIRSGEERDVRVFWREIPAPPPRALTALEPPQREELCPVPIGDLRRWVDKRAAYVFDYLDGAWKRTERFVPGMTVLLASDDGGYAADRGWDPKAKAVDPVPLTPAAGVALATTSYSAESDELSRARWKTIATHGREAEYEVRRLAAALALPAEITRVLALAARWHDAGKSHDVFQAAIRDGARADAGRQIAARRDLAKAPDEAWRRPPYAARPGFRHELASTLALFELLRGVDPYHPALLGPHRELLEAAAIAPEAPATRIHHPLGAEIAALSASDFDLLAWLVCSHHGKVRCTWTSTPRDQERGHGGIHGVCEGDVLAPFELAGVDGVRHVLPALELSLGPAALGLGARFGASWIDRVRGLVARYGPFTLGFLEAVLRVADVRASQLDTEDPLA